MKLKNGKTEIKVTAAHIRLGKKFSCSQTLCPVARAFKAAGFKNVRVGVDRAYAPPGFGGRQSITPPRSVPNFIRRMHHGGLDLRPFSFTLTPFQVAILRGRK